MAEIKLGRLPDRTPNKLTITIGAELHQALREYADMYQAAYGVAEPVTELIPFMLEAFLASDKGFNRGGRRG
ncbi:DUF2274 domain-containing protein [Asticcacaulis sp. SL142]|uniref:DUF2274 domain-containing protein n=1 Tax=Asticcacaulis sp. SL142 TaxID=2995155 RepID=UPI00226D1F16|nr:DUF2274 domain-containing protein [Asticcacaulis sp. SL142]WAC49733.1 DUF2274 domain-containing protein [Asticcacaulis sp. SL142]